MSPSSPSEQPTAQPKSRLLADELEAALRDALGDLPEARPATPRGPGRPPVIPVAMLWIGFLLCVLRGFTAQRAVWRLLALHGFWGHPPIPVTDAAIYQRLARATPTVLETVFVRLTAVLRDRFAAVCDVPYAAFASDVVALDHCTLDTVLRRLKILRDIPKGDERLIPGRLATLFDVRRQLYQHVEFETDAQRNVKFHVERLLAFVRPGTLLLCDLGYFAFEWFDRLTQQGFFWVSRLREKTTWVECHQLYAGGSSQLYLREAWVYLGKYRADRAGEPVRLVEVTCGTRTWRYITNVLDPRLLPAAHIVALYRRRWDIEQAFNLLKTHLKLYLLWSGRPNVVLLQVLATLIIAQVVLALRTELAQRSRAALREVSLPLLLETLPQLAKDEKDPLHELALHGRRMEIIRPFRGKEYPVHCPAPEEYAFPPDRPPPRPPRYAGKDHGPGRKARPSLNAAARQRTKGWQIRSRRSGPR